MHEDSIGEMGPVDYLVIEFAAGRTDLHGEIAQELAALSSAGVIRVLDLLVVQKDRDGLIEAFEIDDFADVDELLELERDVAEILAARDIAHLAEAMENGSTAGVIVWENLWAAPFASATRRAGGQLIASGRIPINAIAAAFEADVDEDN